MCCDSELTAGNDDGAHHLLMALLTLVQQFLAAAAQDGSRGENVFAQRIEDYIDRHFAEDFRFRAWRTRCTSVRTTSRTSARM